MRQVDDFHLRELPVDLARNVLFGGIDHDDFVGNNGLLVAGQIVWQN